jgi:Tfp pilus assembly protein PilP
MKLAKSILSVTAVLAVSFCFASVVGAQDAPAKKPASKAKARTHAAKAAAAPAQAPVAAPVDASAGAAAAAAKSEPVVAKRDPFEPLVSEKKASHGPLPPGKAGLIIGSVRVDGTVKSPGGMLAVVSNEEQRVYFIREGDRLYDGDVEKIGLDGVTFKENSKDAFGKPVERMVTKRIYPSAGAQQ